MSVLQKQRRKLRRAHRTRARLHGTASRPRLSVNRTAKHISAQLIDDDAGKTVFGLHDSALKDQSLRGVERAAAFGKLFAEGATAAKVSQAVFDRGSFVYHGRVKAFADAVREGGIQF